MYYGYNTSVRCKVKHYLEKVNKFALLWGEAQLCLPYIRLRKRKEYNQQ